MELPGPQEPIPESQKAEWCCSKKPQIKLQQCPKDGTRGLKAWGENTLGKQSTEEFSLGTLSQIPLDICAFPFLTLVPIHESCTEGTTFELLKHS